MSKMPTPSPKKRRLEDAAKGKTSRPQKRIRKQKDYHSSSDEESDTSASDTGFAPVTLQDSDDEPQRKENSTSKQLQKQNQKQKTGKAPVGAPDSSASDASDDDDEDSDADPSNPATGANARPKTKRNDPSSFSTSISKILSTKLPTSTRSDPLLSRSAAAHTTTKSIANDKLESRAKSLLRAQRKAALDAGRVTDVLGLESGTAGEVAEEEKRLRKIAQRGVVKLFNAVRVAQVRSEEAMKEERERGVVGRKEREERGKEMSKEGFLEVIGGRKARRDRSERGDVEK